MPTGRYIHAVGGLGGTDYAAGGYVGSASNSLQSYDIATNSWTVEANMPTARYRTDGAVVGNCFHVLGGYNGSNLSTNEGFCSVVLPGCLDLEAHPRDAEVNLTWRTCTSEGLDAFSIERAGPTGNFEEIGRIGAWQEKESGFFFTDAAPLAGTNLYRIRTLSDNGEEQYSAVVEVEVVRIADVQVGFDRSSHRLNLKWEAGTLEGPVRITGVDVLGRVLFLEALDPANLAGGKWESEVSLEGQSWLLVKVAGPNRVITKKISLF